MGYTLCEHVLCYKCIWATHYVYMCYVIVVYGLQTMCMCYVIGVYGLHIMCTCAML